MEATTKNRIRIKVDKDNDKRRISILQEDLNFSTLQIQLCQLFEIDLQRETLTIKYRDGEGDWITISSDQELEEALTFVQVNALLHLSVFVSARVPSFSFPVEEKQKEPELPPTTHVQTPPTDTSSTCGQKGSCKLKYIVLVLLFIFLAKFCGFWILLLFGAFMCLGRKRRNCGDHQCCNQLRTQISQFLHSIADKVAPSPSDPSASDKPTDPSASSLSDSTSSFSDSSILSYLEEIPSGEVEKFHNNLEKLEGMGWKDKNENIKFLIQANGDLNTAINALIKNKC